MGFALGRLPLIKYTAALCIHISLSIRPPGVDVTQPSILNLDAILSFLLKILFMISFYPYSKLAARSSEWSGGDQFLYSPTLPTWDSPSAPFPGWIYTYVEEPIKSHNSPLGLHLTIFIGQQQFNLFTRSSKVEGCVISNPTIY